ncbi:DUF1344 domain-containing protein [Pararhizobium sp.]|uniref:DUF1344 domain-containing protein n=1 Tax=Pararhizobium sp. TaxID=1977563 RepID=UPI0027291975|nr:DUF1344 domain-containing protein [Pararhizobium sp.]MDO9417194.1 DUF1344 domain-containing protein [Pararhizobium sp.]
MRALLTSLTVISAISLSSAAFAAGAATTTGTVKAFNAKEMTLTLKNGTSYVLPAGFKDPGLKPGEKVKIAYETTGKQHAAKTISILQ